MSTFRVRPGSFQELRGKVMVRSAITYAVLLVAAAYIFTSNPTADWTSIALAGCLFIGAMVYSWFRTMKRQRELFESMQLTIDDEGVTRTQQDTPTKSLTTDEITRIEHLATGVFIIRSARAADVIWMPAQVEFPEELARELSRFGPVQAMPAPAWYKTYASLLGLLVLPVMYLFYTTSNKIVTIITGALLISSLAYSQWIIRRSKDLDNSVRRASWAIWLVLLSLLAGMIAKLQQ